MAMPTVYSDPEDTVKLPHREAVAMLNAYAARYTPPCRWNLQETGLRWFAARQSEHPTTAVRFIRVYGPKLDLGREELSYEQFCWYNAAHRAVKRANRKRRQARKARRGWA